MNDISKKELREKIKRDTERFLAKGNKVTYIKTKVTKFNHKNHLSNFKNTNIHVLPLAYMLVA